MSADRLAIPGDRFSLRDFLRSVEAFSTVRQESLERLAESLVEIERAADEMVFRAGEPADAIYILRSGQVAMFTDTRCQPVRLVARLGPAELLGIVGTQGGSRRVASARAVAPTRLLRLSRADFLNLIERDSNLGFRFTSAVLARHARNAAGAVELGHRHDIRIRVDRQVDLVIGHRKRLRVRLANLSRGGICFSGTLTDCFPDSSTWYAVHELDGQLILRFNGRVAWRQGNRTGLAFAQGAPAHDLLVQAALRQLLEAPSKAALETE